jgi:hypothetical protein
MRSDWGKTSKQHRTNSLYRRCHDAIHGLMILTLMLIISHANCGRHSVKTEGDIFRGKIVSFSRIGIAGIYTDDYQQVWNISEEENAEQRFIEMIEEPGLDRKLYALMGLKIISSDNYNIYKNSLLEIQTRVTYGGGGCIIGELPVSGIVKHIDHNQLPDPR